jgi:arginyl-tRNA synthetase
MKEKLLNELQSALKTVGIDTETAFLDYPENPDHGDFSTNVALINAKKFGANPVELAQKIVDEMKKSKPDFIKSINIAGAGFINFFIKDEIFAREVIDIANNNDEKNGPSSRTVMVEYTDPNPFKELHIGHLMSNAIGESISRLIESDGTKVVRANWQGDVGPHVAKTLWGVMHTYHDDSLLHQASFWGKAYALGDKAYESDESAKKEIDEINKKIYDKSDPVINELYEKGRKYSLEAFENVYKRLGTKFDNYFFESIEGRNGEVIVREHIKDGTFEESEGAIVFKGENHGLHTRVFITSHGLPTYETKELGLNTEKFKLYPDLSQSIIITANEQNDYFRVLLKVFSIIVPSIAEKTKHMSHGLMRFASGKMSSRKGNVITAESLIDEIKSVVKDKMVENNKIDSDDVADQVAIAAIKYSILRTSIGSDIIFDSAKSISFEGDSGPYLQYSAVRAGAVLEKGKSEGLEPGSKNIPESVTLVEKLISRFDDVLDRARGEYAPQLLATYLINLAGAFNSFYNAQQIIDAKDPLSPYRLTLTKAFRETMKKGLWLLGIKIPEKM